eukprot:TRINITY_DN65259_c0_g1_i1.p1 TRINITY_DN65259_c0_g1~~TRINITY_DN65259_c0_g1_i1.p1  ORF type:complete len:549 (+),score=150.46 TRINITY_DN65259_c0_g1_i1:88-1734(+)
MGCCCGRRGARDSPAARDGLHRKKDNEPLLLAGTEWTGEPAKDPFGSPPPGGPTVSATVSLSLPRSGMPYTTSGMPYTTSGDPVTGFATFRRGSALGPLRSPTGNQDSRSTTLERQRPQSTEFLKPARSPKGSGKRRALLIGINYTGKRNALRGSINDTATWKSFLLSQGWPANGIKVLADDNSGDGMPTRANIMREIAALVDGAASGDSLFFHFSGHGGQQVDEDGDEDDGFDETLLPSDWEQAGPIVDDELFEKLVKPLPRGCKMTAVLDSCHSGTVLDLPYVFTATKQDTSRGRMRMAGGKDSNGKCTSGGEVVMFSGCSDEESVMDLKDAGKWFGGGGAARGAPAGGACTNAMIGELRQHPEQSLTQLLEGMRQSLLNKGLRQTPQLCATAPIELAQPFSLTRPYATGHADPAETLLRVGKKVGNMGKKLAAFSSLPRSPVSPPSAPAPPPPPVLSPSTPKQPAPRTPQAAPAPPPPLAAGWEELSSGDQVYYWNRATGETTWKRPVGRVQVPVITLHEAKRRHGARWETMTAQERNDALMAPL